MEVVDLLQTAAQCEQMELLLIQVRVIVLLFEVMERNMLTNYEKMEIMTIVMAVTLHDK